MFLMLYDLSFADFKNWMNINDMMDIPTHEHDFTSTNRRKGNQRIDMRLDRAVCNVTCLDLCKNTSCSTFGRCNSDHHPILLQMGDLVLQKYSSFRFMVWCEREDCQQIIQSVWTQHVFGCLMLVLQRKLKILKAALIEWNKNIVGDVHRQVARLQQNLQYIHVLVG